MEPTTAKYSRETWLTDDERFNLGETELFKRCDPYIDCWWWRVNNLYIIANEKGLPVVFRCRPAQTVMFCVMWFLNIILKARQLGFSTAIQIFILDHAIFNNDRQCGVIAQGLTEARAIFSSKILYPHTRLPSWLKTGKRAVTSKTKTEIHFANDSYIRIAVSFRSGTLQVLHVSEYGKICAEQPIRGEEVQSGSLNSIHEGSLIFVESTAEGASGLFFDMSMVAMHLLASGLPLSQLNFKFHFFPWFQDLKYSLPVPSSGLRLTAAKEKYFTTVELAMSIRLTDEQKYWYVNKEISQKGKMKQEFPSTPMEAFLTSGRKVFDADDLMRAESRCTKPLIVYEVDPVLGTRKKITSKVDLSSNSSDELASATTGYLLIWELPDEDEDYSLGADVAEGLEHGDHSSFDIAAKSSGRQVAHWFGHLSPKLFANLMAHIGRWYNNAFMIPERNNHGHAVIQELLGTKVVDGLEVDVYPHHRIYTERHIDRERSDEETVKMGWYTSAQSKPILTSEMYDLFANEVDGVNWAGTMSEFQTFVYNKKGAMGAQSGGFDDQAMSWMITQKGRALMPNRRIIDNSTAPSNNKHWMAT